MVVSFNLRRCRSAAELDSCVALQQQAWGYADGEVVPRNIYVLAQALGGHVIGAWDAKGGLAGFAIAMAAHEPTPGSAGEVFWMLAADRPAPRAASADTAGRVSGENLRPTPYLHSHMLAVRGVYQDCGLGFALKRAQRDDALVHGILRMRWTFDPLMAKNAFFNLQRLGATAGLYVENFYGKLASKLQGGLPSDRLVADWPLESGRVRAALARQPFPKQRIVARVNLPAEVATLKAEGQLAEGRGIAKCTPRRFPAGFPPRFDCGRLCAGTRRWRHLHAGRGRAGF